MLTAKRLRELLSYDQDTGVFRWRARRGSRGAGKPAGYIHHKGYRIIRVDGTLYPAARLAWLYVSGRWPLNQVDHINRIRGDDRIANLREATLAENSLNRVWKNTSGFKGVRRNNAGWAASIMLGGERHYLGTFPTPQEASLTYRRAALLLHGEFAAVEEEGSLCA